MVPTTLLRMRARELLRQHQVYIFRGKPGQSYIFDFFCFNEYVSEIWLVHRCRVGCDSGLGLQKSDCKWARCGHVGGIYGIWLISICRIAHLPVETNRRRRFCLNACCHTLQNVVRIRRFILRCHDPSES
jgi:hypothetical protein